MGNISPLCRVWYIILFKMCVYELRNFVVETRGLQGTEFNKWCYV